MKNVRLVFGTHNSLPFDKDEKLIESIGGEAFEQIIADPDYMATWRFIEEKILKLTD